MVGITITRANGRDFFRLALSTGLLSPLHTARARARDAEEAVRMYVPGTNVTQRRGQVSLKNRVAIPVSTWRKMKRAFHAPALFSRFLVMNSSASHYDEFPRERTQRKLRIPALEF